METDVLGWVALTVCLALSFLLSGMEAGVFALNRLRVRQMARAGRPSAKLLHGFLENPERFMWTILVGNTLANFFIIGWMVTKLYEWLPGHGVWLVAVFVFVVFLFYACEYARKNMQEVKLVCKVREVLDCLSVGYIII